MNANSKKYTFNFEIENLKILITLFSDFFYEQTMRSNTHCHNSFEFHIISQGETVLSSDSGNMNLTRNQACIIPPNIIHTWNTKSGSALKNSFCFSYEKTEKRTVKDVFSTFDRAFGSMKNITKIDNAGTLIHEFEHIMSVCRSKRSLASTKLKLYFSLFMLELADGMGEDGKNDTAELDNTNEIAEKNLRRIIIEDYINQYYRSPISLESLSKVLHLSTKQTERIFTREMNMSFKSLVIKLRLETAMQYLKETDISVTEVAQMVGYGSYNGFYRLFLSKIGTSPQKYREQNKENVDQ